MMTTFEKPKGAIKPMTSGSGPAESSRGEDNNIVNEHVILKARPPSAARILPRIFRGLPQDARSTGLEVSLTMYLFIVREAAIRAISE